MIKKTVLSVAVVSLFAGLVSANPGCDDKDAAIGGINLTGSIISHYGPVDNNRALAREIIHSATNCDSDEVYEAAIKALSNGLDKPQDFIWDTCMAVAGSAECAEIMELRQMVTGQMAADLANLCRKNEDCAIKAIQTLEKSLNPYATQPTTDVIYAIASIVRRAPKEDVKEAALAIIPKLLKTNDPVIRAAINVLETAAYTPKY